ncbi:MAG TPA: DUF87 domain-containing protein, partial [Anaerolineae bacterium]
MSSVGYVVGEVRTDEFTFVTNKEIAPPRLEYIVVRVNTPAGENSVLAQVTSLSVSSRVLDTSLSYSEVESILSRLQSSPPIVVGRAKVLGYLDNGTVRYPRHAATPGSAVEHAPDDLLKEFFSVTKSGIEIGSLINRANVPVLLNPNGLRRHLAVIAQTGAGKSYTVGVILEKLLQLGGTVVVFDPNSDYVLMRRDRQNRATAFANRVQVFRLPSSQVGRISDDEIGGARKLTMKFSQLEVDELCAMSGIGELASNIRKGVQTAYDNLRGMDYTPNVFLQELRRIANGGDGASAQPAAPGAKGRRSKTVNPAVGNEEEFNNNFHRALTEKANVDVDWEDLGKRDTEAEGEADPEPEATPARNGSDNSLSLDAISGAAKALKYIEKLERMDVWGYEEIPVEEYLAPMTLSVIDVAGVDHNVSDFVVD